MTKKGELLRPLPPHGTRSRYVHRLYPCRDNCPNEYTCRMAHNDYQSEYRRKNPHLDKRAFKGHSRAEIEARVLLLEQKYLTLSQKMLGFYRQIQSLKLWLEKNPPK